MTPTLASFHDKHISLWQAAIDAVIARSELPTALAGRPGTDHPLVAASAALGQALAQGETPSSATAPTGVSPEVAGVGADCVRLAWELAWATISNNAPRQLQLQGDLDDAQCDPRWAEAVTTFIEYFWLSNGNIPYRTWRSPDDYVIEGKLPENATIAFLADWGTGMQPAADVLAQVAQFRPDVLIHLGDIYYAGTLEEVQKHFLSLLRAQPELAHTACFTLAGNHDMYSGGHGYYSLIDQLGQPASFFCLQNEHWQFQALDTGYHDHTPAPFAKTPTYVEPSEAQWHRRRFAEAAGRKIVLLSHHQLFSAFDARVGPTGTRMPLLTDFQADLPRLALWLWGHEHRLAIYEPYQGLQKGRCIGCGALPMFAADNAYDPKFDVPWNSAIQLSLDGDGVYRHGYAIMKLQGPDAAITYYEAQATPQALWSENL